MANDSFKHIFDIIYVIGFFVEVEIYESKDNRHSTVIAKNLIIRQRIALSILSV